jgi:hypothetical protein
VVTGAAEVVVAARRGADVWTCVVAHPVINSTQRKADPTGGLGG